MPIAADSQVKRREALLDIVERETVTRQADLVQLLRAEGFTATQSSVSRDLRELGIAKLDTGYARITDTAAEADVPPDFVRECAPAGANLTVVRTATGAAQRVALFLDRSEWPEIVGTVSGDDTIFVATRNAAEQKQLLARLRAFLRH